MADRAPNEDKNMEQDALQGGAETERSVVVITGASSGIGRATALEFAEQGYDLVLAARRKKELDEVARQVREYDAAALVVPTDTTDDKAVQLLADAAVQKFGRIDVWVNDAAVYLTGKFEDTPLEDMHRLFDTNFFGYVHGSQVALAEFRRTGHGVLINISSVNASAPQPYVGVYSASKAAIRALDESLRMELRLDGLHNDIHVCTVMPASVDTNLFQNSANYTGQEIQALEPVYNPGYVAKQIVKLARRPKREILIGPAGRLMALQNAHMPRMYEKQMSKFTRADLLGSQPATLTDGNLYNPIEGNRGIRGGWREHRARSDYLNANIATGAAVLGAIAATIGILVFKRRQQEHHRSYPKHHHSHHGKLHALFS